MLSRSSLISRAIWLINTFRTEFILNTTTWDQRMNTSTGDLWICLILWNL
jgi:hypothetical protein